MEQISSLTGLGQKGPLLRPIEFSTAGVPTGEQFEAFRAFNNVVDVRAPADAGAGYRSAQSVWVLGTLLMTRIALPQRGHSLRWRHWEAGEFDHWYLVLPGSMVVGQLLHTQPASLPMLYALGMVQEAQIPDDGALIVYVPRSMFPSGELDGLAGGPVEGGGGRLLADFLVALHRTLPDLSCSGLPDILDALKSLIAACTAPTRDRLRRAQPVMELTLLERGRRVIRRRLAEGDLSPDMICKELGVSRSRLYRLFEPLGGISSYVRRQRLLQVQHALRHGFDDRPICAVAEQWGFVDASSFSRAYRKEFGHSPRANRAGIPRDREEHQTSYSTTCPQSLGLGEILRWLEAN